MESIPFFNAEQVKQTLTYKDLIPSLEKALADFSVGSDGGVSQPLRATAKIEEYNGFLSSMPAFVASQSALACKLVSFYPNNSSKQISTHMATIILFDEQTGQMRAIMDGEVITAMRTAAVSAIATKHLAERKDILALIGSGVQAKSHAQCFLQTFPSFKKINIWNHRKAGADQLAKELRESFVAEFEVHDSIEDCVKDADVIVVATFATNPILFDVPMKPWVHINSVGAPRPDWQEMSETLMKTSVVYVDSTQSALHESGDVIISGAAIHAEIGEVILGKKEAVASQRTIFKSLGMALEDAVSAQLVYKRNSTS